MISRSEIETLLTDFTKLYVKEDFTLDKSFKELGLRDIDKVEIIIAMEFKTKTWLENENSLQIQTLNQLVDLLMEKAEEKENAASPGK
jgi:acyl carrier protein